MVTKTVFVCERCKAEYKCAGEALVGDIIELKLKGELKEKEK